MEHIEKSIENYLEKDTDYAFLITGAWGSGKTHFLKEQISKLSKNSKRKFALISLYGINSTKEISKLIFLEKYPIAKNKLVKYGGKLAQLLVKGMDFNELAIDWDNDNKNDVNVKLTELGSGASDIKKGIEDDYSPNENLILCFDDFERKGDGLTDKELIGYIDNIVQKGIKVIILSNQEKIKTEHYNNLKEKSFGIIVEYKPDLLGSINQIVSSHFKKIEPIITQNQSIIEEAFLKNSQNLRILKFALSHFESIYKILEDEKLQDDDLVKDLLRFTLAFSIEYREGNISFNDTRGIESSYHGNLADLGDILNRSIQFNKDVPLDTSNDTYRQIFSSKYFKDNRYDFFQSVYDYLTGGYLNEVSLLHQVKEIIEKREKPQYQIYQKLTSNISYLVTTLEDEEYVSKLKELLEYAQNGDYDNVLIYGVIVSRTWGIDNPLKFEFDDLAKLVLKGYKNHLSKTSTKQIREDKYHLPNYINNPNFTEEERKFFKLALPAAKEEELRRLQIDTEQINDTLSKGPIDFLNTIFEYHKDNPILNIITVNDLYEKVVSMKNNEINNFNQLLKKRYEQKFELLVSEQDFLKKLRHFLETAPHQTWLEKPLKKRVINYLGGTIGHIFEQNRFALKNYENDTLQNEN